MKALKKGGKKICALKLTEGARREMPCLCITEGNVTTVFAIFTSEKSAQRFMNELAEFVCGNGDHDGR